MSRVLHFLSLIGDALLNLVGGWDSVLSLLVAMMGLDYISGIIVACVGRSPNSNSGCLDSRSSFRGLLQKGLTLMVLAVAAQIDQTLDGSFVRATTAWFYIANEAISVLENAALAGVPMPIRLLKILGRAKEAQDPAEEIRSIP
jgi:toxin secretion/phage lysis holin